MKNYFTGYTFERNFEFYAGLGGKTKINSLKEILSENPFIISDLTKIAEFDYEKTKFDFRGGLRFNIMNTVSANIGLPLRRPATSWASSMVCRKRRPIILRVS